ncbi:MAG: hypothetical protein J7501_18115 [Bdellovibrio sp.]|nr:hypothetical protein [Bdellovibrio sp.]
MRNIIQALITVSLLVLTSCTSNEGAMKKAAVEYAEKQFAENTQKEADEAIPQSDFLKKSYVEFMKKYSEISAAQAQLQGDNNGVVMVVVKTYPKPAKKTLLKIAGTVSDSEARRFNFANALQLIAKETGSDATPVEQPFATYSLHKGSSGDWKVKE